MGIRPWDWKGKPDRDGRRRPDRDDWKRDDDDRRRKRCK